MGSIIANQSLSANEWAKKAGTSHTNITRFFNQVSKYIPSSRTIAKLVKVAGTHPYTKISTNDTYHTIKIIDENKNKLNSTKEHNVTCKLIAIKLHGITGYELSGINAGDIIIVQKDVKKEDQDIIMYEIEKRFFVGQIINDRIVNQRTDEKI